MAILRNGSILLGYWMESDTILKVYVFNYTNINDILNGTSEKVRVKEVGPYVYRENIKKINLIVQDDKISYSVSMLITYISITVVEHYREIFTEN